MSLPKKGVRRIQIEGVTYAWLIRKQPTYCQGAFETSMNLAVQVAVCETPCLLLVDLCVSRPDNWVFPHQTMVTPATVKTIITTALAQGWKADSGGSLHMVYSLSLGK